MDFLTRRLETMRQVVQRAPLAQVLGFYRAHPVVAIAAAALVLRIAFILISGATAPPIPWGDDPQYDLIATKLVTTHEYANTWYPPGYPLTLALIYSVFGRNLLIVRIIQAVLGVATCLLTYRLGSRLFDEHVGRIAGLLLTFYPGHAYMSWRIMAETLFMFLLVLGLNVAIGMARRPRVRDAIVLGLIVGFAQLVKSNLYVFPFLMVAWAGVALGGERRQRLAVAGSLAATLLLVSLVTPIANRLSANGGSAALPGNAGRTFWMANNPLADGYYIFAENEPEGRAFIAEHGYTERLAQADAWETDRLLRDLALIWIRENPGRFARLCLKKLDNAFGLFPRAVTMEGNPAVRAVHILTYGLIAPFALAGMIGTWRRWRELLPLYLAVASYVLMVVIFYGTPRFTIMVMPVLMVFASAAMWRCAQYVARLQPALTAQQREMLSAHH